MPRRAWRSCRRLRLLLDFLLFIIVGMAVALAAIIAGTAHALAQGIGETSVSGSRRAVRIGGCTAARIVRAPPTAARACASVARRADAHARRGGKAAVDDTTRTDSAACRTGGARRTLRLGCRALLCTLWLNT